MACRPRKRKRGNSSASVGNAEHLLGLGTPAGSVLHLIRNQSGSVAAIVGLNENGTVASVRIVAADL